MHLLCLLGRGGLARTDSPNGFIGDDGIVDGIAVQVEQAFLQLFLDNLEMTACLTLFQHLTHAINGRHIILNQTVNLLSKDFVGLTKVFPSLAVTHNAVVHIDGFQHLGRHLACVSTLVISAAILCAHIETLFIEFKVGQQFKIREWRADDDFAVQVIHFVKTVKDVIDQGLCLIECEVHFPVSSYDFASHSYFDLKI